MTDFAATEKTYTVKVAANDNVKLEGLADESTVTSAAVEKSGMKSGEKFTVTLSRTGEANFAADATFTLTLANGMTATAKGAAEKTLSFEFVVDGEITTSVVSLTKN